MHWGVHDLSCSQLLVLFSWLCGASPPLAGKNIINMISVLTIWWCLCVELSLVLLEEGVCYDQCVLLAKLCSPFPSFILYSKAKFACYSRYLLTSYFCIPVPYDEKDHTIIYTSKQFVTWKSILCNFQLSSYYWTFQLRSFFPLLEIMIQKIAMLEHKSLLTFLVVFLG